ncbi:hypothetical protein BGZ73_000963 [Actinomortierella ambigua]|nr:hypothetical protein BGZ73_000963 [Actinomortierella ambigua]
MSSSRDTVAVDSSFLACPCLNIKLHLPTPVDNADSLAGTSVQLGLGGVSMEQKILGALTLTPEGATVSCSNCNQVVYSFEPTSPTVKPVSKTSVVFLTNSSGNATSFSPSNGRVVPQHGLIAGQAAIEKALAHPDYSHAFRLILFPSSTSSSSSSPDKESAQADSEQVATSATASTTTTAARPSSPLPPPPPLLPSYLQRIRALLDQELETSLMAQEQRTLARIAAYKSQQLQALEASQAQTVQEKERLWQTIQQRVAPPTTTITFSSNVEDASLTGDRSLDAPAGAGATAGTAAAAVHPFEIGTLPVRFSTDLSTTMIANGGGGHLHNGGVGGGMQRWLKPVQQQTVQNDVATSLQLKEFDDRMHSIGMRRQSKVSGPLPQYDRAGPPTAEDLAASQALVSRGLSQRNDVDGEGADQGAAAATAGSSSSSSSPQPPRSSLSSFQLGDPGDTVQETVGSEGRISHGVGAARHITIVEPAEQMTVDDTTTDHIGEDDEDSEDIDDDDDGVVFDLDEELGFDDSTPATKGSGGAQDMNENDEEDDDEDEDEEEGGDAAGAGTGHGKGSLIPSRSGSGSGAAAGAPSSSMVVGSLRLNYLRRQKRLEAERQKLRSEEKKLDEELQRGRSSDEDEEEQDDAYRRRSQVPPSLLFGSSLPIQIHRPSAGSGAVAASHKNYAIGTMATTTTTTTTTTATMGSTTRNRSSSIVHQPSWMTASSQSGQLPLPVFNPPEQLTLPPASSPAGEMLRRRLSRTYGTSMKDGGTIASPLMAYEASMSKAKSPLLAATTAAAASSGAAGMATSIPQDLYTGPGTIAIDPFMLLDDDDDEDDEMNSRMAKQGGGAGGASRLNGAGASGINTTMIDSTSTTAGLSTSMARSAQPGFEPPHVYSARTYVGSTPWEMPTRVTVKAGGADREGADLDMQLTLQMARELEEAKRTEKAELREARRRKTKPHHHQQQGSGGGGTGGVVEMIQEESELAELELEQEEEDKR